MADAADFIGRGITFPMRVDQSGTIAMSRGAEDIDASLRVVLLTAPGERVMRPLFGCRIWELMFEPINANTLGLMGEAVREAVGLWEPRVIVQDVRVEPDSGDVAVPWQQTAAPQIVAALETGHLAIGANDQARR